jgi:hypothetical protein
MHFQVFLALYNITLNTLQSIASCQDTANRIVLVVLNKSIGESVIFIIVFIITHCATTKC